MTNARPVSRARGWRSERDGADDGERDDVRAVAEEVVPRVAALRSQAHVYGAAGPELARSCAARELPLHVFSFGSAAERAGVVRNALYLVRPDGYVALADPSASPARLARYLETRGLRPGRARRAETPRGEAGLASPPPA